MKKSVELSRCRHYGTWLISGGNYEWCYACGALRRMWESGIAQVTALTQWARPTGDHEKNPWPLKELKKKAATHGVAPAKGK